MLFQLVRRLFRSGAARRSDSAVWRGSIKATSLYAGGFVPLSSVARDLGDLDPGLGAVAEAGRGEVASGAGNPSQKLRAAFTPSQPIRSASQLIGRGHLVERALSAIVEDRRHVVILGERGLGKTSLANVVAGLAAASGYRVIRHPCDAQTNFSRIMSAILGKLPPRFWRATSIRQPSAAPADQDLIDVAQATDALSLISAARVLIVLDEFDRVQDPEARSQFVELLKNLSDGGAPVTFFLIGVAQSIGDLLTLHRSIQRSITAIHVPLLSRADIELLIRKGEQTSGLTFAAEARSAILSLSARSPYFAQLLCLHSGRAAIRDGTAKVAFPQLRTAIFSIADELAEAHGATYRRAVAPAPDWLESLLLRAAMRETNPLGQFSAVDLDGQDQSDDQSKHRIARALIELASLARGGLLRQCSSDPDLFSFYDPVMRLYILLRHAIAQDAYSPRQPAGSIDAAA